MGLAHDVNNEITQHVERVLADASCMAGDSAPADADDHLLRTAHYFDSLAAQLLASGLDGGTDGTAGAEGVAHRIEQERRRLRQLAAGSYGSSGFSSAL